MVTADMGVVVARVRFLRLTGVTMVATRGVAAGCLVLLAGCGASPTPESGAAVPPPVRMIGNEVALSCYGDAEWAPSTMPGGLEGVLSEAEARAAFRQISDDPNTGGEANLTLFKDGIDVEWRVLHDGGDTVTIGLGGWTERGPVQPGAFVVHLVRQGDGWTTDGWNDCSLLRPRLTEGGGAWAQVENFRQLAPDSLEVDVSETECVSGRDPGPYLHEPTVFETRDAVTLYWTTTPADGNQNCQGSPVATRVVQLRQPLGTRQVLDGSRYPPRPIMGTKVGSSSSP